MRRFAVLFVSASMMTLFASGCGVGPVEEHPPSTPLSVSGVMKQGDFSVTLTSQPRVADVGRGFSLTLTVRNLSGKPRTFEFSSGQTFDFFAYEKEGAQVWRWSEGMMFIQSLASETIEAGGNRDYKASWDAAGQGPGKYAIEGVFLGLENLKPKVDVEISSGK